MCLRKGDGGDQRLEEHEHVSQERGAELTAFHLQIRHFITVMKHVGRVKAVIPIHTDWIPSKESNQFFHGLQNVNGDLYRFKCSPTITSDALRGVV